MIKFLHNKEINKSAWDLRVEESPEGQIFHYSWYLDVCDPDWHGLVDSDYNYILPISIRSKFGIQYAYQPFFVRHGGVIGKESVSKEVTHQFITAIPAEIKYIDFCLYNQQSTFFTDFRIQERHYQLLDISGSYDQIAAAYSENHKRSLRKAEKAKLIIQPDYNPNTVVEQFRILKKDTIKAFDEGDYRTLNNLMQVISTHNASQCHAVLDASGLLMAAGFFMISHNRIIYLKGFSSPEGRNAGAMHFLFDRLIRTYAGTDKKLDFGGSDVENVARFYKGFGAADCLYLRLRQNRLPQLLRWLKK
jgi:hypothetical protein